MNGIHTKQLKSKSSKSNLSERRKEFNKLVRSLVIPSKKNVPKVDGLKLYLAEKYGVVPEWYPYK